MSEALISQLDREDRDAIAPAEGSQKPPKENAQRELEKVKFPEFWGAPNGIAAEAWLENMSMYFALCHYTSNMKVCMAILQLKGSGLLWWKTLLLQLGIEITKVS